MNGCFSGLEIAVDKDSTLLGRDVDCDICLDHSFVSPQHASITRSGDFFVLEDLNSRHGTSVGGREVHRIRLKNGDIIGIGNFQIRFRQ
ncbi:MAG TPA: FHA domain-containing protein [Candidatus Krumholzibacterium sp.]|nr:FHA domain-containing protein [Candidatus Krumholzibacterium sp.]